MLHLLLEVSNRRSTFKLKSNEGLMKGNDLPNSFIHSTICIECPIFQITLLKLGITEVKKYRPCNFFQELLKSYNKR